MASKMEMGENIVGPEKGNLPLIDCIVTDSEGVTQHVSAAFPVEELSFEPWGVKIGDNQFMGLRSGDGTPAGYSVKVAHEDIGIDIKAKAVALGVRFVEEDHGCIFYDPTTKMAIGWWPLTTQS